IVAPAGLVLGGVALEEHLEVAGGDAGESGDRQRQRHHPVLGGAQPAQQQREVEHAREQRRALLDREEEHAARDVARDLAALHHAGRSAAVAPAPAASCASSPRSRNARRWAGWVTSPGSARFEASTPAMSGCAGSYPCMAATEARPMNDGTSSAPGSSRNTSSP